MCRPGRESTRSCLIQDARFGRALLESWTRALGSLDSGRYAQIMGERRPYPSDLPDDRWGLTERALQITPKEGFRYGRRAAGEKEYRPLSVPDHTSIAKKESPECA